MEGGFTCDSLEFPRVEAGFRMNETELSRQTRDLYRPNPMQPIALRSMFWRPAWLEASAWQEHIPFAFWLIEAHRPRVVVELGTHHGTSYFALCQAVDRLGLDTRCFAIDTWKGDEHAGFYDESVYESVSAYNDTQYSGFSRLVRSSFDDALKHFSDGTVDLLHIDGVHTLEAATHDFESWLPKLSDSAVVIFHDTNVRERGFGVFQLFERLKKQYPAFEFVHGHGLGVLGVGEHQTPMLKRLFESDGRGEAQRSIHEVFARLGRCCADAYTAQRQQAKSSQLSSDLQQHKKALDDMSELLSQTRDQLKAKAEELASMQELQQHHVERHALERGQLVERATMLQEAKVELKEQVSRLQGQIDATREQVRPDASLSVERLSLLEASHTAEIGRYKAELERSAEKSAEDKERQEREKKELRDHVVRLNADRERHDREMKDLVARLHAAEAELADIRNSESQGRAERDELMNAHAQAMDALITELDSSKVLNAELEEKHRHDIEALLEAKRRAESSVQARFAETAQLTRQLIEHQRMLADRDEAVKAADNQLVKLNDATALLRNELDEARRDRDAARESLAQLQAHVNSIESSRASRLIALLMRARIGDRRQSQADNNPTVQSPVHDDASAATVQSEEIRLIQQSGLFECDWYRQRYPDVAQVGMDPVEHYLLHGASESRDPGPAFSTARYLVDYPDVADAGLNPLVHYLAFGRAEGRVARPSE